MHALGSPIEAPVSELGFDYITMRALGLPIAVPFHVFACIVISMREQSVDRDPCLSNVAVLTECQCANGECLCANGNHRSQNSFLANINSPIMTQEKGVIVTNDR
jgi:hypothetical protein